MEASGGDDLGITVDDHGDADYEPEEQDSPRLEAIEPS
jgi:hypothetical protein